MKCPQCGTETPDEEWNCVSCRINIYWATQHYEELARIREQHGDAPVAPTPGFLINVQKKVVDDRAERGGKVEHKVRKIARDAMNKEPESER